MKKELKELVYENKPVNFINAFKAKLNEKRDEFIKNNLGYILESSEDPTFKNAGKTEGEIKMLKDHLDEIDVVNDPNYDEDSSEYGLTNEEYEEINALLDEEEQLDELTGKGQLDNIKKHYDTNYNVHRAKRDAFDKIIDIKYDAGIDNNEDERNSMKHGDLAGENLQKLEKAKSLIKLRKAIQDKKDAKNEIMQNRKSTPFDYQD